MFKHGYKIIFIKEGKFNLRQFNLSPLHIVLIVGGIVVLTSSIFIMFSDQFVKWAGSREIEKHSENNQILFQNIEKSKKQIDDLFNELDEIKKQDDILRKLVKLPPIHEDIRKMGFGGTHNKLDVKDVNYLLPENHNNLDEIENDINYVHRLINLELLSYKELAEKVEKDLDKILTYPAIYPVETGNEHFSSKFGYRRDPFSHKYKFHDGHDYSCNIGTSVYTTANGRV